jgi:hypothetical protein
MILKLVPSLSGLISLVMATCTTNGVARTLLLDKAISLHIVLNQLLLELLNNLPPFLPLGISISQGLVLHFE